VRKEVETHDAGLGKRLMHMYQTSRKNPLHSVKKLKREKRATPVVPDGEAGWEEGTVSVRYYERKE